MHDNGQPEPAYQEFLSRPICDLGLKLEGSPVERFVEQLYRELEAKGLTKFRPACYLTDEWGCPSGEPIIGIPFYLAHAALSELVFDLRHPKDEYLRSGHAPLLERNPLLFWKGLTLFLACIVVVMLMWR